MIISGTNYELDVTDTADGWHAVGYVGDVDIDTEWCDVHDLSFDELDALICAVMRDEL